MATISQVFASQTAAIAALKAANVGLTSNPPDPTTHAPGPDTPVHTGADASGARFDLFLTPLTTPGTGTVSITMPDGSTQQIPAPPTLTGQVQVDLFWQGATPPTLAGGTAASAPVVSFTPPTPPAATAAPLTFLQFMALFTPAEQAAIVSSTDAQVKLFTLMASGAGEVDLPNAEVIAGVNYLATAGLIQSARVATILAGKAPS